MNGPTSNRVGTQFSFDSLRILAVTVSPTIADWSLLRVGNWTHFNCPKSVTTHRSILGCFWQQVSDGFHGQKADIRAPASASPQARQWKIRVLGGVKQVAEREGFDCASSSKYSDYYHLRILACVYAACKHIFIFGCTGKSSPQSPPSRVLGRRR
jgi:hypothetical protein